MVSELTLGFWAALLSSPYEGRLVRSVVARSMKKLPAEHRTRHFVAGRLKAAQKLRNRAFHREAVWRTKDLGHQHQMLGQLAGWLYPTYTTLVLSHDRFGKMLDDGLAPFRTELQDRILKELR